LASIPERRWIGIAMAFYGFSVALATVYGRYHFATDAIAGILISLLAIAALKLLQRAHSCVPCRDFRGADPCRVSRHLFAADVASTGLSTRHARVRAPQKRYISSIAF
jgi:membrane-associated phospholipid phosphatase